MNLLVQGCFERLLVVARIHHETLLHVKEKVMSKRGKVKVAEKRILISVSERMHQDLKAAAVKKGARKRCAK